MKVKWKAKASLPNYSISELAYNMFVKKTKNIQNGQTTKKWRPKAVNNIVKKNFQTFDMPAPQVQVQTGPAKLQLTNLDFGVTEQDIKDLFSNLVFILLIL